MKMIDAHNHLMSEPGYLDRFLRTLDELQIEQAILSGIGPLFVGFADNAAVRRAFEAHPDRILGAVFVRPGVDDADAVTRGYEAGFRMVKIHVPKSGYDDPAYFPIWGRAQELGMPVLFHTGVVNTGGECPGERVSSWNMHPMRIEPITREFPDLQILVAHLGVHWNMDAAELARMRPNVYVDLSGEPGGWRDRADACGMDTWLWWPGAFRKVVFGTDVHASKMARIVREDSERLERLGVDTETRRLVFAGNILNMLGKDET